MKNGFVFSLVILTLFLIGSFGLTIYSRIGEQLLKNKYKVKVYKSMEATELYIVSSATNENKNLTDGKIYLGNNEIENFSMFGDKPVLIAVNVKNGVVVSGMIEFKDCKAMIDDKTITEIIIKQD